MTDSDLGKLLLAKRQREGLNLRQAGAASGIAFSTLARIENGKQPSLKVDRLARAWLNGEAPILPTPPMTLRDWFAGQVIEQCVRNAMNDDGGWDPDNVAYHAYLIADAMLAARARATS